MNAKKILVTGAGGYIGRHVVNELVNRGYPVLASDLSAKGINPGAEFIDVPLFSGDKDIYDQFGRPDALIHLAWRDGFIHNSNAHMQDLSSHISYLIHMIDSGLPVLSVMGSMHEIGYWEGAIKADTPCNPMSQYGIAKNALRQSLLLFTKQKAVSLRWLRAYYIYGDDAHGSSIFAKICKAANMGQKEFPFTMGKNKYDFIHVAGLARQIVSATLQNEYEGTINVCTGNVVSLAEQVESYIAQNHLDIKLKYGAFPDRPYDSPAVWGDATIIQEILKKENL